MNHPHTTEHRLARRVQLIVAKQSGITLKQMVSKGRGPDKVCWPRHVAMRLIYETSDLGPSEIGKMFGRCHSDVYCAIKTTADRMATNRKDLELVESCRLECAKSNLKQNR